MSKRSSERATVKGDLNAIAGRGGNASVHVYGDVTINRGPAEKSFGWPLPWDFSGYIREKRQDYIGRAWLFKELREWYEDENGAQALLLCADFGVGKSAFMAELTSDPHGLQIAAHHFCHHDTFETLNPATFVRSVAAQLAVSLPEYRAAVEGDPDARRWLDDVQGDPASAFERAVIGPLSALDPAGASRILLVDALDEALDFEAAAGTGRAITIVRLLAARARRVPWLRILATTRSRQDVLQPMQSAFRCRTLNGEDVRNLNDIRHYVAGRCARAPLARVVEEGGRSAREIAAWLSGAAQSGGKFLYAVRVLNDVESGALPLDRLHELPPGMDGFYLDAFERRFPESEDDAPVRVLLGVLCVQREPLSQAELAAILGTTEAQVGKMLKRLEDFLQVRAKRYAFDHLSLAQWLSEENEEGFPRGGRFSVDLNAAEGLIADWARRELATERTHESAYLARHLGAYLSPKGRRVHYARLLLDFCWLDARLRAAGANAILMDFADVGETPALEAVERALRHSAHVLGRDGSDWQGADQLASQILGRLQPQAGAELYSLRVQAAEHFARNAGWRPLCDSLRSTEALIRAFDARTVSAVALAALPDGRLAAATHDNTIRLWNPANGVCDATLEGHADRVCALAMLPDGRLASGSHDRTIRLWNLTSGVCQAMLEGHTDCVEALAVLSDGRLASASRDTTIRLWNTANDVCEAKLEGLEVDALAALPDGRLAVATSDNTIRLWNTANGMCDLTFEGHTGPVRAFAVLDDGRRLASASPEEPIKLWNPVSGLCEGTLEENARVRALAALADGRLASGSTGKIRLWNLQSGECEVTLEDPMGQINALAVLPGGRLASGSWDSMIRLWNPASGVCDATPEGHTGSVTSLAVLADGRLASGAEDHSIRLWNPASGVCEATLEGHMEPVSALAALANGQLASGSWDRTIRLWNPESGACEATLEGHTDWITALSALSALADGRLASGSADHMIRLWNPGSGVCEAALEGHTNWITMLAVLADGRFASGQRDETIRLSDPLSGACEATLEGHTDRIAALAVLASGRLASGSWDHTIRLWNTVSGTCEATLEAHTDFVTALAVLDDGRLASGSDDGTIRVWQVCNGRWIGAVRFVADFGISTLAFAARAAVLAAGDLSGRVHFLKVEPVTETRTE